MKQVCLLLCALLIASAVLAEESRTPVSVTRIGSDQVGALFAEALKKEIASSKRYEMATDSDAPKKGVKFYIELVSVDVGTNQQEFGGRSAISVVIEAWMSGSWPVPDKWYHKIPLVPRQDTDEIAKKLVADIRATWCNYLKSSIGGCPKEEQWP